MAMTTLTIRVENKTILSSLKKILAALDGVTILHTTSEPSAKDITKTAGYKEAMSDKNKGRISGPFETSDELFAHLDI